MPSSQFNGFTDAGDISRIQSPRPETPEPYVRQGRRNAPVSVQLLDDMGTISEKVCLLKPFLWGFASLYIYLIV
jgi:hypothetical protein